MADYHAMDNRYTMDDRYQVGDEICGLVWAEARQSEAFRMARSHQATHDDANDGLTVWVFDCMAHVGSPEEWTARGKLTKRRSREGLPVGCGRLGQSR